ncbi:MAG: MBL fold metallo-hydrolase [Hyphomicrobiales bacterium]|nr:MBL fold metallo-hydrolase [Hyphomicrobiales bacterium]
MDNVETTLTLIGGPTVLIELEGVRLLTDPTFDPPGEYPGGVLLKKTAGPALTDEQVGPVDAVLLSHDQHADNLDHGGRAFLEKAKTTFITEIGAARLAGNSKGLKPFETATIEGANGAKLFITATPARHGPPGVEPLVGDVIGFLIGRREPGDAIYITGDTVWYEGTAEVAKRYRPKLVIAFAGSAETRARFHLTMDANDVLEVAHAFPAATIVGVHNHGWAHFAESAEDLAGAFAALKIAERLAKLEAGKPTRFLA